MSSLFKAIDINGNWRYGDFFTDAENQKNIIRSYENNGVCYSHTDYPVRPSTECFYSGFEDKMNNRIFENDILYFTSFENEKRLRIIRIVKFKNGKFVGEFHKGTGTPKINDLDLSKCIENQFLSIGNIHDIEENPFMRL